MISPFDYKRPKTLQEACSLLQESNGRAKVIAGGTDLIIQLRNGDQHPSLIIDIAHLKELQGIEESVHTLSIGAAVTHAEIAASPLIRKYGKVLSLAASQIGSPQIRNVGTIGGNVINASPAADTLPPLLVLNGIGSVVSSEGEREVPLSQLFKGPYASALKGNEILVRIVIEKLPAEMKGHFLRIARREAMAIARISLALLFQVVDGLIRNVRVAPGAILPTPQRLHEVESFLEGRPLKDEVFREASKKISEAMVQKSGVRPSTAYKAPVIEALFIRAIREALEQVQ